MPHLINLVHKMRISIYGIKNATIFLVKICNFGCFLKNNQTLVNFGEKRTNEKRVILLQNSR